MYCGFQSKFFMNVYFEKHFNEPIDDLRQRMNFIPAPKLQGRQKLQRKPNDWSSCLCENDNKHKITFKAEFPEAYYPIKWYRNLQGWISRREVNATVSGSSFVSWCFTVHLNKVYSGSYSATHLTTLCSQIIRQSGLPELDWQLSLLAKFARL